MDDQSEFAKREIVRYLDEGRPWLTTGWIWGRTLEAARIAADRGYGVIFDPFTTTIWFIKLCL